ncbi:MAG: hypothetical protein V7700_05580 [Halioglobus sp.]
MSAQTVNTVTGAIDVHELGVTLMHEHLLIGYPGWEAHTLVPDEQRVQSLVALLQQKHEAQIVVSHDSVWCTRGKPSPDDMLAAMNPDILFNPTHFHRNIIPHLLAARVTQQQIDTLPVDNPRRFFTGDV